MPRADWGISASDARNFDREAQYKPYTGPKPAPRTVFQWQLTVCKFFPKTRAKNAQLRLGLKVVPRNPDEKRFKGFFVMTFRSVTPKTQFAYVPFLDAIGVSESDFVNRTQIDEEGNIRRIGNWRNDGKQLLMGEFVLSEDQNGAPRNDVGWIGELEDAPEDADLEDDDDLDDDEYIDDDDIEAGEEYDDEEEEEPEPAPKRRTRPAAKAASRATPARRGTVKRRRTDDEDAF